MNIGIIAGVIMGASYVPYIVSILRGHTKPERGSRIIWTSLAPLAFYAQYSAGATNSLWFTGTLAFCSFIVLLLSITRGEYGFTLRDLHIYALVFIAAGISIVFKNPFLSLLAIIFIDANGGYLTVRKVIDEPYSENITSYALGAIGATLTVFAVGEINTTLLLYPVYVILLNVTVSSVMYKKRRTAPVSSS